MVLTHADVQIGTKNDTGPMYDYKTQFFQYGAGYYPADHSINLSDFSSFTDQDYIDMLHIIGFNSVYDSTDNATTRTLTIKAFQMHYAVDDIGGVIVDGTRSAIINYCVDMFNYKDKFTGIQNQVFITNFTQWKANHSYSQFDKYINVQQQSLDVVSVVLAVCGVAFPAVLVVVLYIIVAHIFKKEGKAKAQ